MQWCNCFSLFPFCVLLNAGTWEVMAEVIWSYLGSIERQMERTNLLCKTNSSRFNWLKFDGNICK